MADINFDGLNSLLDEEESAVKGINFDGLNNLVDEQGDGELSANLGRAVQVNPDEHANVVKLSERTGLPSDVVEGGGDDIKQRERVHDIGNAIGRGRATILMRKMKEDLDFAKASHDDVETLSAWELLSKKFQAGQLLHEEGVAGTELRRTRSVESQTKVDEVKQRIEALGHPESEGALSFFAEASEILGQMTSGFAQSEFGVRVLGGATIGGTLGLAGGPIAPVTSTAGAVAGGIAGMVSHMVIDSFEVEGGLSYIEQIEEGIAPDVAQFTSLGVGVVNAALELAGETVILAPFAKVGKELFKSGIKNVMKRATVKGAALEAAKVWGKSTGTEVVTEMMQESVNMAATEIGKAFSEGNFEDLTAEDIEDRLAEIAVKTFKGMAVLGLGGGSASFAVDANRARKARIQQDIIGAMGENAQASKLRERLPRKYREFVEDVKKGGEVQDVFVNTEKMIELFQSPDGGHLSEAMPELAAKIEAAVSSTDDFVAIPLEDYQAFIAGTDAHAGISKDIKFRFDEMSFNEAADYESDLEASFREEFAEVQREAGEQELSEDVANQVFDRVRSQLQTAGRATTVAGQEALAHKAFARVLQKRYGLSAEQVGALYGGLQVKGELPEVIRDRPKGEVDLLLERVRTGKGKTEGELFGQSLVDFVRDQGIDIDSPELTELLGFDIDKDLKPSQKKALREGGQRLDDLALAAQQAGFFPEIASDDRIDINTLLEGISEGLQGRQRFLEGVVDEAEIGRQAAADDLAAELDRRDIDINLSNDEIIRLLEEQEVTDEGALFQYDLKSVLSSIPQSVQNHMLDKIRANIDVEIELNEEATTESDIDELVKETELELENLDTIEIPEDRLDEIEGLQDNLGDIQINELPEDFKSQILEILPDDIDASNIMLFLDSGHLGSSIKDIDILRQSFKEFASVASEFDQIQTIEDAINAKSHAIRFEAFQSVFDALGIEFHTNDFGFSSRYIFLDPNGIDLKIRFADHANISSLHPSPDVNIHDGVAGRGGDFLNEILSLLDPRILFQGEQQEGIEDVPTPRGSIQFFPDDKTIINLMESADPSTFLHESAHFFVHVLEQIAPQSPEAQRDLDAMMKFVGATDASQFALVENQEKLARGFEAYLREGKAPSIELQSAFARFKSWLLRVYENMLELEIDLSPEIREVFDRMLATDEEIDAAEQFNKFVVNQNLSDVLSPADRKQLNDSAQKAKDTAEEELLKRKINELEREETKAWKAERAKVREEIKSDVDNRSVYRAIDILREKENGLKMAKDDVEDLRGAEILGHLPTGLTGKEGVHPDVIADLVGVQSGDQLLMLLFNAAKNKTERNQIIKDETDAIMNERHGSLNENKRHAIEAANEAVFSDDRAKFIALEAKLLNKLAGEVLRKASERDVADIGADTRKADLEAVQAAVVAVEASGGDIGQVVEQELQKSRAKASVTGRRAQSAAVRQARDALNVPASVVKEQAKRVVALMKMNDALAIGRFTSASQRFGKQAALAIARRDYAEATGLKQRQLLNHYMALESRKARKEVDYAIKYFGKFKGRANKTKSIATEYVEKIKTILDAYQFTSRMSPRRETILELQTMNDWIIAKQEDDNAILQIPPAILQATETTHWRDMTLDEIRGVHDAVKNLEVQGRNKLKLLASKEKAELQETVNDMAASLQLNFQGDGGPPSASQTQFEKRIEKIQRRFSLRKIESMLREWDGFKPGIMQETLFAPLSRASTDLEVRRQKGADSIKELFNKYSVKESSSIFSKKVLIPEIGDSFTKESMLAVALNVGNADNRSKMMENYGWNEEQLQSILDHLDERDWNFVQDTWDYIDTFWNETVELDKETKGFAVPKVEAETVVTKFGEFRGGYYPLKYSSRLSDKATEQNAGDVFKAMVRGEMGRPTTNQSRTKARVASVSGLKVRLDLGVMLEGIDETMHDLAFRKVALDVTRVLHHSTLTRTIRDTYGPVRLQQLKDWLRDAVAGDVARSDEFADLFFGFMRRRTALMTMGYKVSTFMIQPLGYTQTAARFIQDTGSVTRGLNYAIRGITEFYGSPRKMKEKLQFVYDRSPMMLQRSITFDRDLNDTIKGIKNGPSAKYQASLLAMIGKMQKTVDLPTWLAAYEFSLDNSPSAGEEVAAEYADSVVRLTQGAGLNIDLAAIQRGSEGQKTLTMYMTFFNAMHNMVVDEFKLTRREGFKRTHLLITNIFLLTFMPANLFPVIFAAFGVGGPDEDDGEGWLQWMVTNWLTFGVGGIPIARDFASSIMSGFPYQPSPIASSLKSAVDLATQVNQGELDKALFKSLVKLAAITPFIPPLPASQISLTGEYFWDYMAGEKDEFNLIEAFMQRDY